MYGELEMFFVSDVAALNGKRVHFAGLLCLSLSQAFSGQWAIVRQKASTGTNKPANES